MEESVICARIFLYLVVSAEWCYGSGRGDHRNDYPEKRQKTSNDDPGCSTKLDETIDSLNDLSICETRPPSPVSYDIADYANKGNVPDNVKIAFLTPNYCEPRELTTRAKKSPSGFVWDSVYRHLSFKSLRLRLLLQGRERSRCCEDSKHGRVQQWTTSETQPLRC